MDKIDKTIAIITGKTEPQTIETIDAISVFKKAQEEGHKAGVAYNPTPMIVSQHENMANDNSRVTKQWVVNDGLCGFAWVNIPYNTPENRQFINQLKKLGIVGERAPIRKDHYYKGFTYWIGEFNQSHAKKVACAGAFAEVLNKHGIKAYSMDRLD